MIEENEVDNSAETTTQDDLEVSDNDDASTSEGEVAETTEGSKQQSGETPEQRRARIKRMYEREFGKPDNKGTEKGEEGSKEGDDRYARLELKTEGVTSKKAQDIVLEYIKEAALIGKKIEPAEALKSLVVKEAIAELEKKTSAPAPSKRTNTGSSDDFAYWVAQAKKGNFPRHDKAMMEKLAKARIW
jgi:hypothetical protein